MHLMVSLSTDSSGETTILGCRDYNNMKLVEMAYLIGSLYFNTSNNANPSMILGFGTWVRYAQGRALVGIQSSDADFS